MPCDGARQNKTKARMGLQDGTESNTEEQRGKSVVIQDTLS